MWLRSMAVRSGAFSYGFTRLSALQILGKSDERRRKNLYLFLAMFTVVFLLAGINEMNQRQWFNSRPVFFSKTNIASVG
jgi:hypothetical protein